MNGIAPLYRVRLAEPITAGDTTPMMVFPIGEWHSAKYADLPLTEDLANELIANFESGILGTEPVVDSSGKHDTSAPAAGWVKRVYLASYEEGDVTGLALWADVKWTPLGAELLTSEQYKYGSVEIGSVVLNDSGETVDNVLRSLTLTNTPVLRLMPGVKNAAEKQRDVVTLSLSEVSLTTTHEDDGTPAEPRTRQFGRPIRIPRRATKGSHVTLDEGDAAQRGSDQMKTVALKLALAEDASEETILAEVTKLAEHDAAETERANAAEVKLAEAEAAKHAAEVAVTLDEAMKAGEITTAERITLAEKTDPEREMFLSARKGLKVIELGERGSDDSGPEYADATVELAEKAKALVDSGKAADIVAAQDMVLAESPDLKVRLFTVPTTTE